MQRPANQQVRSNDSLSGRLSVDSLAQTARTYLKLPATLSFAEWNRIGKQLFLISDSSTWWIGDWLVFGEEKYPDRYRRAIAETGLNYGTLRNYAWVARRFPVSRRHDKLSFQHHLEVAGLPDADQGRWLNQAAEYGWSKSRLRAELRASRGAIAAPEAQHTVRLQVAATEEQRERWQKAASQSLCDLDGWIVQVLDQKALSILEDPVSMYRDDR